MIILGSASPRRQRILADSGITFEVVIPAVEEIHHEADAEHTVVENSRLKLEWCRQRHPDRKIITADTVVVFKGVARGKPTSLAEAKQWLAEFSNNHLEVFTAMGYYDGETTHLYSDTTTLFFKKLDRATIDGYCRLVNPLDKAGGFNIDEHGDMIIASTTGSYSTIMGLCKERLLTLKL